MPESSSLPNPADEVRANLRKAAQLLREPHSLGEDVQRSLAEVVTELEQALARGDVAGEDLNHLRESTAHLVEALRQHPNEGLLSAARDRLTQTVAAAEVQAPFAAGIARRLLDALANIGI